MKRCNSSAKSRRLKTRSVPPLLTGVRSEVTEEPRPGSEASPSEVFMGRPLSCADDLQEQGSSFEHADTGRIAVPHGVRAEGLAVVIYHRSGEIQSICQGDAIGRQNCTTSFEPFPGARIG